MTRSYWIVKQEPQDYSWTDFIREERTAWTGVRNFQARNHLRAMRKGDFTLFYHSGTEKQLVGIARVAREAYPDPTASDGDWSCVDLVPVCSLATAVALPTIRADAKLAQLALVRQSRLSVLPVTPTEFRRLLQLAGSRLPK